MIKRKAMDVIIILLVILSIIGTSMVFLRTETLRKEMQTTNSSSNTELPSEELPPVNGEEDEPNEETPPTTDEEDEPNEETPPVSGEEDEPNEETPPTDNGEDEPKDETPTEKTFGVTYMMSVGGQIDNIPSFLYEAEQEYPTEYEEGTALAVGNLKGKDEVFNLANESRTDYSFKGWYMDSACTISVEDWDRWTGNLVVFAKVDIKEYTIAEVLVKNEENILINLTAEETIFPTCTDVKVWGGESTKTITVNGNGNAIVFANLTDCVVKAKDGVKLIFNDVTIQTEKNDIDAWNIHDVWFKSEAEFNNVRIEQEVAFGATGKTMKLNNVTIDAKGSDMYVIWLQAGTHLEMTNCQVLSELGRAVKVADEYIDEPTLSTVTIKDTKFASVKKGAILVSSTSGANIVLENVDIENVEADTANAVWVDIDYQDWADKVTVIGGHIIVEP